MRDKGAGASFTFCPSPGGGAIVRKGAERIGIHERQLESS